MTKEKMIDSIIRNSCPYKIQNTNITEQREREKLNAMSLSEVAKIYNADYNWLNRYED